MGILKDCDDCCLATARCGVGVILGVLCVGAAELTMRVDQGGMGREKWR